MTKINTAVNRQFSDGYVQLDVTAKNAPPRYYKIKPELADSFGEEIKKQTKNMTLVTNAVFILSMIAGVLGVSLLTKKLSTVMKYLLNTAGGVAGATVGIVGCGKYFGKQHDELMKKYGAKEIFYKS